MERFQRIKPEILNSITLVNPTNDEINRVIAEQGKNPYIEVQQRLLDKDTGNELGTSTIIPYLMTEYGLSDGLIGFMDGFQRHSDKVQTQLVVKRQPKK